MQIIKVVRVIRVMRDQTSRRLGALTSRSASEYCCVSALSVSIAVPPLYYASFIGPWNLLGCYRTRANIIVRVIRFTKNYQDY